MTTKALLAVAAMIALTACTGHRLGQATNATPDSTEFGNALSAGYLRLAKSEQAEGDYQDADYFALRSMAAGRSGETVALPEAKARKLPQNEAFYVATAREELVALLDGGARERAPQLAATAQISFECWIQELEENHQPDDIAACRDQLDGLIPALRNAIAPPKPAKKAKPPKGKTFVVYFETGKSNLSDEANAVLAEAVKHAANFTPVQIVVSGYADTVGRAVDNDALSMRRAAVVAAAMRSRGIPADVIRVNSYGENFLAVATPDNTPEAKNRRAEISVAP